jgi:hypothetical protein
MSKRRYGVKKTAISVSPDVLEHVHRMVRQGVAPSVSGYFSALAARDRSRRELLEFVTDLEAELGMTDADRQHLDHELALAPPQPARRTRRTGGRRAS